jgi:hypothetical protein
VNNRRKTSGLFPKSQFVGASGGRLPFLMGGATRALGVVERSVTNFVAALPVVDVAFLLLVIAYVKAY